MIFSPSTCNSAKKDNMATHKYRAVECNYCIGRGWLLARTAYIVFDRYMRVTCCKCDGAGATVRTYDIPATPSPWDDTEPEGTDCPEGDPGPAGEDGWIPVSNYPAGHMGVIQSTPKCQN